MIKLKLVILSALFVLLSGDHKKPVECETKCEIARDTLSPVDSAKIKLFNAMEDCKKLLNEVKVNNKNKNIIP